MTLSNISNIFLTQLAIPDLITPIDRRNFVVPYNNTIGNSRLINPITSDYQFNSNGKIGGYQGVQQQVYLSLVTVLGSSASVNLGQTYSSIQVITQNITQSITNSINLALAPLITAGQISLNNILINRVSGSTAMSINISWTDLTLTTAQINTPITGSNQVSIAPYIYECSKSRGISPTEIPFIEAGWRADRGVVAQFGTVSAWWNESAYKDDGGTFDLNRNAIQNTQTNQPIFNGSDGYLNNQPSITFSGTQLLQTGAWTDGYIDGYTTIFCVGYWKDNASTYAMFDGYGSTTYRLENISGTLNMNAGSSANGGSTNGSANAWIIVVNGNQSFYRQSANVKVSFSGNVGSNRPAGFTIGNSLAGSAGGITIAEIAVFNSQLSSYYLDGLNQYAKNRYNIGII